MSYQHGKIYKITAIDTEKIYIGSTTTPLKKRFGSHISAYKKRETTGRNDTVYQLLCFGDAKIELVENFQCNSKRELNEREQYHIDQNRALAVNKQPAFVADIVTHTKNYMKKYNEDNKKKIYALCHEYHIKHRDAISAKSKVYREQHKEQLQRHSGQKELCVCGATVTHSKLSAHMKRKTHFDRLKGINQVKLTYQCACGIMLANDIHIVRHQKSKPHLENMEKKLVI